MINAAYSLIGSAELIQSNNNNNNGSDSNRISDKVREGEMFGKRLPGGEQLAESLLLRVASNPPAREQEATPSES